MKKLIRFVDAVSFPQSLMQCFGYRKKVCYKTNDTLKNQPSFFFHAMIKIVEDGHHHS
jgi:hypothetical protein